MSQLLAAKRWFATEPGVDLQSIDNLGFRPRAIIAWWARLFGSDVEHGNRGGIGFWTDAQSASVAWSSRDGVASSQVARIADAVALLGLDETGTAVDLRAEVESFEEDGLTLRYTQRTSQPWVVHVLALGGAALQSARVGWSDPHASSSRRSRGGDDDVVLVVPSPAELGVVDRDLLIGVAAHVGGRRAMAGYACANDATPGAVTGLQRRNASFVDGVDAAAGVSHNLYLQLEGIRVRLGNDSSPAKGGTRRTRTGFRPDALILFSWGLTRSRDTKAIGRLCIGAAATGQSGCLTWDDRNVAAPETRTHVRSSVERVLLVPDTRTGGIHAEATLRSIDEGGFTLDWIDDRGGREFVYVALARPTPGGVTRLVDRLTRLLRLVQARWRQASALS